MTQTFTPPKGVWLPGGADVEATAYNATFPTSGFLDLPFTSITPKNGGDVANVATQAFGAAKGEMKVNDQLTLSVEYVLEKNSAGTGVLAALALVTAAAAATQTSNFLCVRVTPPGGALTRYYMRVENCQPFAGDATKEAKLTYDLVQYGPVVTL